MGTPVRRLSTSSRALALVAVIGGSALLAAVVEGPERVARRVLAERAAWTVTNVDAVSSIPFAPHALPAPPRIPPTAGRDRTWTRDLDRAGTALRWQLQGFRLRVQALLAWGFLLLPLLGALAVDGAAARAGRRASGEPASPAVHLLARRAVAAACCLALAGLAAPVPLPPAWGALAWVALALAGRWLLVHRPAWRLS